MALDVLVKSWMGSRPPDMSVVSGSVLGATTAGTTL